MLHIGDRITTSNNNYTVIDIKNIGDYTYYLLEDEKLGDEKQAAVAVFYEDIKINYLVIIDYTWDSLINWANDFEKVSILNRFTKKRIQIVYNKK